MSPDLAILSHHKCATNWLRAICRELSRRGLISVEVTGGQGAATAAAGAPLVLLDVNAGAGIADRLDPAAQPVVHFVRDPRDAFVSNYWSWLKSHQNNTETILAFREAAEGMPVEDGMLALVPHFPMGRQLEAWPEALWSAAAQVRYEDLLADFPATLARLLPGVAVPGDVAEAVRAATDFKTITGRDSGQEDVSHHFRKGVAGDWRTYFTPRIEAAFLESWGWMGPRLGYWEHGA